MQADIAQGSYQTKLETAKILKQLGDSVKKIMQATGLSKEEVENVWNRQDREYRKGKIKIYY